MLASTARAVELNKTLMTQLSSAQHRTAAVSLDMPCAACGQALRSRPRSTMPQGVPALPKLSGQLRSLLDL